MRIVVDSTVSLAPALLGPLGELTVVPPREITRKLLLEADALVVRSTVRVGRALLDGTGVRFVGTATSGTDHVDELWLSQAGIVFAAAAGCNAQAVAEYVVAALLEMSEKQRWEPSKRTLGVVGVGHVGSRVARLGRVLGMNVLACDPPLARAGAGGENFVRLAELLAGSDIVTLHVPLSEAGPDATRGLLNEKTISSIRNGALLINTARGAVVETAAVVAARRGGRLSGLVLDVWEGEPDLNRELLEITDIMTPHIAGHSLEGKIGGTRMISDALAAWSGRVALPSVAEEAVEFGAEGRLAIEIGRVGTRALNVVRTVVNKVCDLAAVDGELRRVALVETTVGQPVAEVARSKYPLRREFASYLVEMESEARQGNSDVAATVGGLGFRVVLRQRGAN